MTASIWPLDPVFVGARIQDVRQPEDETVVLETHLSRGSAASKTSSVTAWWLWSVRGASARSGRVFSRPRRKGGQAVFCRWLRTRLIGARVVGLSRTEPVSRPEYATRNEDLTFDEPVETTGLVLALRKGEESFHLLLELNQRGSNLLLLDDQGRLLVALRHPSGAGRKLVPGDDYTPPARFQRFAKSIPFEQRLPAPDERTARTRAETWEEMEAESMLNARKRPALQLIRREVKKRRRRMEKLEAERAEGARADEWQRWGDLLQIHRHALRQGLDSVQVADVFEPDAPMVTISLDPVVAPGENIERCFKRARKLRGGVAHVIRRLEETEAESIRWQAYGEAVSEAGRPEALEALAASLPRRERALRTRLLGEEPGGTGVEGRVEGRHGLIRGVLRRHSRDGFTIFVGRSDKDNDEVTFRLGRGRDWWFHAQGMTGSHVIVVNPKDVALPPATLAEAAWLAAYYSKGRGSGRVEVDYTQRKYVRKVRKGAPGQVTYSQNRSTLVALADREAAAVLERVEPDLQE